MHERYALLIGSMKSGTTALYKAVTQHPGVLACREKEPMYWCTDGMRVGNMSQYRELWDPSAKPDAVWRMEASTGYTKVPVRMSAAVGLAPTGIDARFVYLTRNPLDRAMSQYDHSLARGWISQPTSEGLSPTVCWFSNYRMQLQPYVDCFGRDRILVLSYEELKDDHAGTLRRVFEFLELDPAEGPSTIAVRNSSQRYRSIRLQRRLAAAGLLPAGYETAQDESLSVDAALERALEAATTSGLRDRLHEELQAWEAEIRLSPEQIELIHAKLDVDLEHFRAEWGIDAWTGERVAPKPSGLRIRHATTGEPRSLARA